MVSTLKLTKIQIPNSDSDVLSFNSSTGIMTFHKDIKGEGTATTNLQQGLNKVWINLNGTSTISTNDSFNVSGTTDNGTGDYTITIANDMNNNSYVIGSHTQRNASVTENSYCSSYQNNYDNAHNTGFFRVSTNRPDNASDEDALSVQLSVLGDLA